MGNFSNLLTLRYQKKKEISLVNLEPKLFLYGYIFLKNLERYMFKKDVLILNKNLQISTNQIFLYVDIFFKTKKILELNKKKKNIFFLKNFNLKKNLLKIFINKLKKKKKKTLTVIQFVNFNKKINLNSLIFLYKKFKNFLKTLFIRKFFLFMDFLKITYLYSVLLINTEIMLQIISQIFQPLQKNSHNKFLFFLKFFFLFLLKQNQIKGIKFILNGKLQGKTRASSVKIIVGSVPTQTISANIEFSKEHVFTRYGVFGLKMWMHF